MILYILVSIFVAIHSPELGAGFTDILNDAFGRDWHGYWWWVIGFFLTGLACASEK